MIFLHDSHIYKHTKQNTKSNLFNSQKSIVFNSPSTRTDDYSMAGTAQKI